MKRVLIYISLMFCMCGCRGWSGGMDDFRMSYRQLVLVNRSSYDADIVMELAGSDSIHHVYLEPDNGLWKQTSEEHINNSFDLKRAEVLFDSRYRIPFDDMTALPFNPCDNSELVMLSDTYGQYYVYEFNDRKISAVLKKWEELKTFRMSDIPPSQIDESSSTEDSSETLFYRFYPVRELWSGLRLGAGVRTEAGSLAEICIEDNAGMGSFNAQTDHNDYYLASPQVRTVYYDIKQLQKTGLAHFGCDFAALTGRDSMEKFNGVMAINARVDSCVFTSGPFDLQTDSLTFISKIEYGRLMILLAEADHSVGKIEQYVEYNLFHDQDRPGSHLDDVDFYLISLDENGRFMCTSGGKELARTFIEDIENQPVHPLAVSLPDSTGIRIRDVLLNLQRYGKED